MRERLKNIIRAIISEAIQLGSEESERTVRSGSGKPFRVITKGNKPACIIDPTLSLDVHDESFIKQLRTAFPASTVIVNGINSGSKQFRIKTGKHTFQVLRSVSANIGIVVWMDKVKADNPRKRDGKFQTLADVMGFILSHKKK